MGRCRSLVGFGHPLHAHRHPADQQAIAELHAGQTISPNGAATRTLGHVARREKRVERRGASAVLVLGGLQEAPLIGARNENRSVVILGFYFSGVGIFRGKFFLPRHFNA